MKIALRFFYDELRLRRSARSKRPGKRAYAERRLRELAQIREILSRTVEIQRAVVERAAENGGTNGRYGLWPQMYPEARSVLGDLHSLWASGALRAGVACWRAFRRRASRKHDGAKKPNIVRPFVYLHKALFDLYWDGRELTVAIRRAPRDPNVILLRFHPTGMYADVLNAWKRGEASLREANLSWSAITIPFDIPTLPPFAPERVIGIDANEEHLDFAVVDLNDVEIPPPKRESSLARLGPLFAWLEREMARGDSEAEDSREAHQSPLSEQCAESRNVVGSHLRGTSRTPMAGSLNPIDLVGHARKAGSTIDISRIMRICEDHDARIARGTSGKHNPKAKKKIAEKHGRRRRNRVKQIWHRIAKKIIETAREMRAAIAIEDLRGKSDMGIGKSRDFRRRILNRWSIRMFQDILQRKARACGVTVILVDPKYTSRTCPNCGEVDRRKGYQKEIKCRKCGTIMGRHEAAARNIAARGIAELKKNLIPAG
jgi:IS605 OrfB family transposase